MLWKKWLSLLLCMALATSLLLMPAAALSAQEDAADTTQTTALAEQPQPENPATGETAQPPATEQPTVAPTEQPTEAPTEQPTATPAATGQPTATPAPTADPAATATPLPAIGTAPTPTPSPAPATPEAALPADVQGFYDTILGAADANVLETYLEGLSDERYEELWKQLSPEQQAALAARIAELENVAAEGPLQLVLDAPGLAAAAINTRARMLMSLRTAAEEETGLHLHKSVAYDAGTDSYTLTLEAYARGLVETQGGKPTDLVLVLDTSGSMSDKFGKKYLPIYAGDLRKFRSYYIMDANGTPQQVQYDWRDDTWYGSKATAYTPKTGENDTENTRFYEQEDITKLESLQNAVNGFLDTLAKQNPEITDNTQRNRVGIVSFADRSSIKQNLAPIAPDTVDDMKDVIRGFSADGATRADLGMKNAETVLQKSDPARNQVVIFFSDGEPTTASQFSQTVASEAVRAAGRIKAAQGTVYTIGIMREAKPFADDQKTTFNTSDNSNAFMHALSSNYPAAAWSSDGSRNLGTPASLAAGQSYYLTANDSATLAKVFENISQQIPKPGTALNGNSVLQDVLSKEFVLPTGYTADKIQLHTQAYTGAGWNPTAESAPGVTAALADNHTIRVTGFDYSQTYLTDTARTVNDSDYWGSKLIVTVTGIKPDYTVTYGGQSILTNAAGSGVYPDAEKADAKTDEAALFDSPAADVAIHYTPAAKDQYVYLAGAADLNYLLGQKESDSQSLPNGTNNAYVTTVYTVADAGGTILGTCTVPAGQAFSARVWNSGSPPTLPALYENAGYTVKTTLTAVNDAAGVGPADDVARQYSQTDNAHAWVLVPHLTYQDSTHYYGTGSVSYEKENLVGEPTWQTTDLTAPKLDTDPAVAAALSGKKPAITLRYSLAPDDFDEEKLITVGASIGNVNVSKKIVQSWQPGTDCPAGEAQPEGAGFRVHVRTGKLTIQKAVANPAPNQSFVFTVTDSKGNARQVDVQGAGSITITGLPMGQCTVAEDTAWSWRYLSTNATQTVTLQKTDCKKTVIVHNTQHNTNWLSGETYALNRFCRRTDQSGTEDGISVTAVQPTDTAAAATTTEGGGAA